MQAAKQPKEKQQRAKLQPEVLKQQQAEKAAAAAAAAATAADNDDADDDDDTSEPVCSIHCCFESLQLHLYWVKSYVSTHEYIRFT